MGRRGMRYPACEKLEIIRLVEQSHLSVRRTLEKLGVTRATFYRWCDLYQSGGPEALEDRSPRPKRVWNRNSRQGAGSDCAAALNKPELSPRELAIAHTAVGAGGRATNQHPRPCNAVVNNEHGG